MFICSNHPTVTVNHFLCFHFVIFLDIYVASFAYLLSQRTDLELTLHFMINSVSAFFSFILGAIDKAAINRGWNMEVTEPIILTCGHMHQQHDSCLYTRRRKITNASESRYSHSDKSLLFNLDMQTENIWCVFWLRLKPRMNSYHNMLLKALKPGLLCLLFAARTKKKKKKENSAGAVSTWYSQITASAIDEDSKHWLSREK